MVQIAAAVLVALAVDGLFGEPPVRWHPVVWMGKALGWLGARIAPAAGSAPAGIDWRAWALGLFGWWGLAGCCAGAGWLLQAGLSRMEVPPLVQAVGVGLLLKPLLAWRMLADEVRAVEAALTQGLDQGRQRLSWLVSRDVTQLGEAGVRESAIESLAENLNDSVVAPLFWFVVAGLPGAALFRLANTADAMWGYPAERNGRVWTWAGQWAARADDVLAWLPARLTALLLWPSVCHPGGWFSRARCLLTQASLTPSPNSGWPMAAVALSLKIRLGKPGVYTLNAGADVPGPEHLPKAILLAKKVVSTLILIGLLALFDGVARGG